MFTKKITESDAFLDMPTSTQALYFHLCMSADDDGFVSNPKTIKRIVGASDDDMKLLLLKRFIISFESGDTGKPSTWTRKIFSSSSQIRHTLLPIMDIKQAICLTLVYRM